MQMGGSAWTGKQGEIKRIKVPIGGKSRAARKSKSKKLFVIFVGILLATVLFYTLYIGQLLWGIIIDILILRLYFLMQQEQNYFRECNLNEDEAGISHDPGMRKKIRLVNALVIIFALGLIVYSYYISQLLWGIVVGLMILLYVHMLLFFGKNL